MYIVGATSASAREHTVHRAGGALRRGVPAAGGGARETEGHRGAPGGDWSPEYIKVRQFWKSVFFI